MLDQLTWNDPESICFKCKIQVRIELFNMEIGTAR